MADEAVPWSAAWRRAALGPAGFYCSPGGHAEAHFATAVTDDLRIADAVIAAALPTLHRIVSAGEHITVTDVGAGDGTLLCQLISRWPAELVDVTEWRGVDVREHPPNLHERVTWIEADVLDRPDCGGSTPGLVIAHELLDDIPCDVVETDDVGEWRLMLVDPTTGIESIGPRLVDGDGCAALGVDGGALAAWCGNWWPRYEPAARIEVGIERDRAWQTITSMVNRGLAIAIDYGHVASERVSGRWDAGTIAGYLDGLSVRAIPDGRCNISAHVAIDACAAAVRSDNSRVIASADGTDVWWLVQAIERTR